LAVVRLTTRSNLVGCSTGAENDAETDARVTALQERLQQLGSTAGRNMRIDHRFAAGDIGRYRSYAAELVGLAPDVLVATTTATLQALQQRTHTIPIVIYNVSDPLADGFVASLARPGGNVTGFGGTGRTACSPLRRSLRSCKR
jgi:putative tryptophan/tyrosine transport system substrate-binding protein